MLTAPHRFETDLFSNTSDLDCRTGVGSHTAGKGKTKFHPVSQALSARRRKATSSGLLEPSLSHDLGDGEARGDRGPDPKHDLAVAGH